MEISIKDMVKDNKQATFLYYRDGDLWYATEDGFKFPVPVSDVGNATFPATEKALLLMRYIRKHLALLSEKPKTPKTDVREFVENIS